MFPINRVVALATPLFSAVSAAGSAWMLKHFPGVPTPSATELLGVEIAGATAAAGAALKWLHGHQAWEARVAWIEQQAQVAAGTVSKVDPKLLGELETMVESKVSALLANVKLAPIPVVAHPPVATQQPVPTSTVQS